MARLTIVEARDLLNILIDTVGFMQDPTSRSDFLTRFTTEDVPREYWFANGAVGFILLFDPADGFSLVHDTWKVADGRLAERIAEANNRLSGE